MSLELKGPSLFTSCFKRRPANCSRQGIIDLHRELETTVRGTFSEIKGPELLPIAVNALPWDEFTARAVRYVSPEALATQLEKLPALVGPEMAHGRLSWEITYNLSYFQRHAAKSAVTMLSLITGTLYSPWMARMDVQRDRGSFAEIQTANIGWASYFAPILASHEEILTNEMMATGLHSLPCEPSIAYRELRPMFGIPRTFIPLALFKLEMARGFEAVVELMHRPPGLEETEQGCKLENVMAAFWSIYENANDQLGAASLPREMVIQGSSLREN